MEEKYSIHWLAQKKEHKNSVYYIKYILMELLFPRDDEIGYGKEWNNKNWATENLEYASCRFCNTSGHQADKNHVGEGGGEGGKT